MGGSKRYYYQYYPKGDLNDQFYRAYVLFDRKENIYHQYSYVCQCQTGRMAKRIRAALNAMEAAKLTHNKRIKQGLKPHAKRTS